MKIINKAQKNYNEGNSMSVNELFNDTQEYILKNYGHEVWPSQCINPELLDNFPINALERDMAFTIVQLAEHLQCSVSAVMQHLLSLMATATQGRMTVTGSGITTSTSVMVLGAAGSGERKSSCARFIHRSLLGAQSPVFAAPPLSEFEKRLLKKKRNLLSNKLEDLTVQLASHELYMEGYVDESEIDDEYENLKEQAATISDKIDEIDYRLKNRCRIIYQNTTIQALLKGLSLRADGLWMDDEASRFFVKAMGSLGDLCKLYDGDDLYIDRAGDGSFVIKDPRLTVNLAIQKDTFKKILDKSKGLDSVQDRIVSSGLAARFLTCIHQDVAGYRNNSRKSEPVLFKIIEKLVQHYLSSDDPIDLVLSLEAENYFQGLLRWTEDELRFTQIEELKPWLSRYGQNTLKIAALLHAFSENAFSGDAFSGYAYNTVISYETVQQANALMQFFQENYIYVFTSVRKQVESSFSADEFVQWIGNKGSSRIWAADNWVGLRYSDLQKFGPNKFRKKERLDQVLSVLEERGFCHEGYSVQHKCKFVYLTKQGIDQLLRGYQLTPIAGQLLYNCFWFNQPILKNPALIQY